MKLTKPDSEYSSDIPVAIEIQETRERYRLHVIVIQRAQHTMLQLLSAQVALCKFIKLASRVTRYLSTLSSTTGFLRPVQQRSSSQCKDWLSYKASSATPFECKVSDASENISLGPCIFQKVEIALLHWVGPFSIASYVQYRKLTCMTISNSSCVFTMPRF